MVEVVLVGCSDTVRAAVPPEAQAVVCTDWRQAVERSQDGAVVVIGAGVSSPAFVAQELGRRRPGELLVCVTPSELAATTQLLRITPYVPLGLRVLPEDDSTEIGQAMRHAILRGRLARAHAHAVAQLPLPNPRTTSAPRDAQPLLGQLFVDHREALERAALEAARSDPTLRALASELTDTSAPTWVHVAPELRDKALLDKEWQPYLAELEAEGARLASLGLDYGCWYPIAAALRDELQTVAAPRRSQVPQAEVLAALDQYVARCSRALGTGYTEARAKLTRSADQRALLFSSLVESSNDAIVSQSFSGTVTGWNHAAESLFEQSAEQAVGRSIEPIVPIGLRAEHRALIDNVRRCRSGQQCDTRRQSYAGRLIDVQATISPIQTREGEVIGVSWAFRDISERKHAELERERLLADLHRSNEDLEQFAYVASHDLQEPLRMVMGHLGLMERTVSENLDAVSRAHMRHAVEGARRMKQLINSLLDYARIETRGRPASLCALDDALDEALAALAQVIDQNGAEIQRARLPRVRVDASQLVLVFQNLISNALKFRSARAPRIRVDVEPSQSGWTFSVCDNGVGFDMEHRDRIFQMFQRLHDRNAYEGSGIGLAIVKRIVERHGGSIWAESAASRGSCFHFTLPAVRQEES